MSLPGGVDPGSLPPGLVALTGDEGSGKTRWLRALADARSDVAWLDLALPGLDALTPPQVWDELRARWPDWSAALQQDLVDALALGDHCSKTLAMLSTGSRRKVALVGLLASGATVTCLDQPFVALDAASVRVLREFLAEAADHAARTWVVADYEADPRLPWRHRIGLD